MQQNRRDNQSLQSRRHKDGTQERSSTPRSLMTFNRTTGQLDARSRAEDGSAEAAADSPKKANPQKSQNKAF